MGLVEDVQADLGLLITTEGFSPAAQRRAQRGIRLRVIRRLIVADIDNLPAHIYSPAYDEPYYTSDFVDHEPYGEFFTTISYVQPYESEYTQLPEEIEWEEQPLASSAGGDINWAEPDGKANCARIILRHRLGKEPDLDAIELFVDSIASDWQDGVPWTIFSGELQYHLGI